MARIARVVAPGLPHHVTQRGNRRQPTFFTEDDYRYYLDQLGEWCTCHEVLVWSYCLMPNHVHLIVVPQAEDGLKLAIGETHRRYSRRINFRMGWRGHLWQGRFSSSPMDERFLLAAARYVERNPVTAGIVGAPGDYPWSSARHYLGQTLDPIIQQSPLPEMVDDWQSFLAGEVDADSKAAIGRAERSGRPMGDVNFVARLEGMLDRGLQRHKPGPKAGRIK
jgi:putative transposase